MPGTEQYDAVVICSGEGGKYLAWHLAQAGQKVAVIERRWIGGSCPNINAGIMIATTPFMDAVRTDPDWDN